MEAKILIRVIKLDITNVRYYIKAVRAAKGVLNEPVSAIKARIMESHGSVLALQEFVEWFEHILAIRDLFLVPEPEILIDWIQWAQKARAYYFDHLQAAFSAKLHPLPPWVRTIFNPGRYGIAFKALV